METLITDDGHAKNRPHLTISTLDLWTSKSLNGFYLIYAFSFLSLPKSNWGWWLAVNSEWELGGGVEWVGLAIWGPHINGQNGQSGSNSTC